MWSLLADYFLSFVVHAVTHPSNHLLISHSLIRCSLNHSLTLTLIHSLNRLLADNHSLIQSIIRSLNVSLTYSSHSLMQSVIQINSDKQ